MLVPLIECGLGGAECPGHWEVWLGRLGCVDGEAGPEGTVVEPGAKERGAQALGGDSIAVGVGDAFDEAVHAQATQIVGNSACGVLARLVPEQGSKMLADVLVGERALDQ